MFLSTTHRGDRKEKGGRSELAERVRDRRRRRRSQRSAAPIGVSFAPMIDMTFLLLIFFLVTTTFERAEGILASKMPADKAAAAVPLPLTPIIVRVSQTSADPDEYTLVLDGFSHKPTGFVELADALRHIQDLPGFDEQTPVVIIAGHDVQWDHVVGCWNAALAAGCRRIAFGQP